MEKTTKFKNIITAMKHVDTYNFKKVIQPNGFIRFDFYASPESTERIIADIRKNQKQWICKKHVPYEKRKHHRKGKTPKPKTNKTNGPCHWKILSWNISGIKSKKQEVIQTALSHEIDFVFIQESNYEETLFNKMATQEFCFIHKDSKQNVDGARGIMLWWRRNTEWAIKPIDSITQPWILAATAVHPEEPKKYILMNLYLNSNREKRKTCWKEVAKCLWKLKTEFPDHTLMIGGDWNSSPTEIDSFMQEHYLLGIKRTEKTEEEPITWRRSYEGRVQQSHIDHYVTDSNMECSSSILSDEDASDHKPITISWEKHSKPKIDKPRPPRMDPKLIRGKESKIRNSNYFIPLIETEYDNLDMWIEAFTETAWKITTEEKCIRTTNNRRRRKKSKLSRRTRKLIAKRRSRRKAFEEDPSQESAKLLEEAIKEARKSIKEDTARTIQQLQINLVDPFTLGQGTEDAWRKILQMQGKSYQRPRPVPLKSKTTQELSNNDEEREKILFDHFNDLFSDPEGLSKNEEYWSKIDMEPDLEELTELNADITWKEIATNLKKMGKYKAPGKDGIITEFLQTTLSFDEDKTVKPNTTNLNPKGTARKNLGCRNDVVGQEDKDTLPPNLLAKVILKIVQRIWQEETFPETWNTSQIVTIPKKPRSNDPNDYRGISLIPVFSKLVTSIMAARIVKIGRESARFSKEQAGFRSFEETVAQAIILFEINKSRAEKQLPTYNFFIDAVKAFDRVGHECLIRKLSQFGIRGKMLNLIKNLYKNPKFEILGNTQNPQSGEVKQGVKQGDPLSPVLFIIYMNDLPKALHTPDESIRLNQYAPTINSLMFADDVNAVAHDEKEALILADNLTNWLNKWKMNINASKCAIMIVENPLTKERQKRDPSIWKIQGQNIPIVDSYVYLGIRIHSNLDLNLTAEYRLEKARSTLNRISPFLYSSVVPIYVKRLALQAILIPIMTYGIDIWGWNQEALKKTDNIIIEAMKRCIGASKRADPELLFRVLDIHTAKELTVRNSIRIYQKWATSDTHFQYIHLCSTKQFTWAATVKNYIQELMRLYPKQTELMGVVSRQNDAFENKKETERIKIWIEQIRNLNREKQERTWCRDTIRHSRQVYFDSGTGKWNDLLHETAKSHPQLSKGLESIQRMRIYDFFTTKRLNNKDKNKPSGCYFCQDDRPETTQHFLLECPYWTKTRDECLDLNSETNKTAILHITGHSPAQLLHLESDDLEFMFSENRNFTTAVSALEEKEITEALVQTASFLQRTRKKRAKAISLIIENNKQAETNHSAPTRKQSQITDFFKAAK
ncbi:MAG: hypothetical protein KGL63_02445 [Betaproteobacteria bacterium]|nr:hypothetical protein [Betaproteobacteria bacterium]